MRQGSGSTTRKLIRLLEAQLPNCVPGSVQIYLATGAWRSLDVMRWHGYFRCRMGGSEVTFDVGSWDTVTECLKKGAQIQDCRNSGDVADFLMWPAKSLKK